MEVNMDIKSAYEIAMEKVDKIGEASEEERLKWKYTPEGGKLAALILKEDIDIAKELNKYDPKAAAYIVDEAVGTLLRNIVLPRTEINKTNNKRAMDGIKILKKDKTKTENILNQMHRIFNHYNEQGAQQRRQAYQQVKEAFEVKVQQALQQQMGSAAGIKIDIEKQPQFQEEWRKVQNQLDSQYIKLLDEFKQELLKIK
jgi:hypothetical protein